MITRVPMVPLEELTAKLLGGKRSSNTVCVVRYGAIGDMIMMSSILPELKKQGYRICVNTTPSGLDIVKNDPNIDEFLIQENKQIPMESLNTYWDILDECFDKVINLSESIESTLIMQPQRVFVSYGRTFIDQAHEDYFKTKEELGDKYEVNYMERTHEIAEVPFKHLPRFYPTVTEKKWAKKQRKKIRSEVVVMIVLSGSSTHKTYPYVDAVISRLLMQDDKISFVTVGDTLCKILEGGWDNEKRVVTKSGEWSVRQTLAFLNEVDIVVGPETGVMNAASTLPCRKIVYLSHSSVENLSKHWVNTKSISGNPPCYPCHKMHNGNKYCNTDENTGAAQCAVFDPNYIVEDINEYILRINTTTGKGSRHPRNRPVYNH